MANFIFIAFSPNMKILNCAYQNNINIKKYNCYKNINAESFKGKKKTNFGYEIIPYKSIFHKGFYNAYAAYKKGEISIDKLNSAYSKAKIFELIAKSEYASAKGKEEQVEIISQKLDKGDVESSNTEMLMRLVENGELSSRVLLNMPLKSKVAKNAAKDIDELYETFCDNTSVTDKFIKQYDDEDSAKANSETGDIVRIKGEEYIRIKMEDKSLKEIFLTPETYLKLFPPIERYSYSQSITGDCFLFAAITSLYSNPNTRFKILEMFKENKDGDIVISTNGFKRNEKNNIVKAKRNDFAIRISNQNKDEELSNTDIFSQTCMGVKFLEYFFEKGAEHNAEKKIKSRYDLYKYALTQFPESPFVYIEGLKYEKSEMQNFIDIVDDYKKHPEDRTKQLISTENIYMCFKLMSGSVENLNFDEIKDEKSRHLMEQIKERYIDYFSYTNEKMIFPDEIIPIEAMPIFYGWEDNNLDYNMPYIGNGGQASVIFSTLGLDSSMYSSEFDSAKKVIEELQDNDDLVCVVNSLDVTDNDSVSIFPFHSYSLSPISSEKGKMYSLKNPYNTCYEQILSIEDIIKYFGIIEIGGLKNEN